ncbi:MAG: hypothetical protein ACJAVV_003958, partial [Alphaproteobacteria bacterium]
ARKTRDNNQLISGQGDVNIFEVMRARTSNADIIHF